MQWFGPSTMNVDIGFMAELAVGPLHQFHIGMNLLILMRFGDSSSFRVIQADERLAARSETSKSEPVSSTSYWHPVAETNRLDRDMNIGLQQSITVCTTPRSMPRGPIHLKFPSNYPYGTKSMIE
jgi:hypothetical protein